MGRALTPLQRALEALQAVDDDPARARDLAGQALALSREARDPRAEATALRALGLAERDAGRPGDAEEHLRAAVRVAEDAGLGDSADAARVTLALWLALSGDGQAGLAMAEEAAARLTGVEQARALAQRALILARTGRPSEALPALDAALQLLRRHGDARWTAAALANRGLLRAHLGDHAGAQRDLAEAAAGFAVLGSRLRAAQIHHNLGFVATRRGDIPTALASFDAAERELQALGHERHVGRLDRCETLLAARMPGTAAELAAEAVADLTERSAWADAAEARLLLARSNLLAGADAQAAEEADAAAAAFTQQARPGWALLARVVALQARGAHDLAGVDPAGAAELAASLDAQGWPVEAGEARVVGARAALERGDAAAAARVLRDQRRVRGPVPVALSAARWHATALLRLAEGDRRGAAAAVRAGLAHVERHRATLGATELRAHASGHGGALAQLGLGLALEDRRPRAVLAWLEHARAAALALPPTRPPDDAELAADLAALRSVAGDLREAAASGQDTAALRARLVEHEQRVAERARRVAGGSGVVRTTGAAGVLAALGERCLVAYLTAGDRRAAVVVADGRVHLRELGAADATGAAVGNLRFALRRLADPHRPAASHAAAAAAAAAAGDQLEAALLTPLARLLGDRDVVIVPDGPLASVPWSGLPALADRPTSVAPSATVWVAAAHRVSGVPRVVALAAGPRLAHAQQEIADLAADHGPHAQVRALLGGDATAPAVLAALDGADLAHVAAHGRFRDDNPLFSSLDLADGPLTVHDLQRLRQMPGTVVLSACDSAKSAVLDGGEVLGLGAALLGMGAATVVASPVEVNDAATAVLMRSFHAGLRAGDGPARALAAARTAANAGEGPALRAAAAAFACFGAG